MVAFSIQILRNFMHFLTSGIIRLGHQPFPHAENGMQPVTEPLARSWDMGVG